MLLGRLLPEWLQDGAHYGLEDAELELDSCLIQLVALRDRHRGWKSCGSMLDEAKKIHREAKLLEDRLVLWAAALPASWTPKDIDGYYLPQETHRTLFPCSVNTPGTHVYTMFEHAVKWNVYRAARLIILEIGSTTALTATETEVYASKLESARLINDICASVPYHFGRADRIFWDGGKRRVFKHIEGVRARAVGTLVVPLIIALCRATASEDTQLWLKEQLKVIGEIVGNKAIGRFLEQF